jgi:protein import protein ZIM17
MKEKGQLVKKGTLGVDGDIEFWDDGTETARQPSAEAVTDGTKGGTKE